jgi:hypothetical protein
MEDMENSTKRDPNIGDVSESEETIYEEEKEEETME